MCAAHYVSNTTDGKWWVLRQPGYIVNGDKCPSAPNVFSYYNNSCYKGLASEYIVTYTYNDAPILFRTDKDGNILGVKTVGNYKFYLVFIQDTYLNKTGSWGCAREGMEYCNDLETISYNNSTYYGVWLKATCVQDGKTCPASGKSIKQIFSENGY